MIRDKIRSLIPDMGRGAMGLAKHRIGSPRLLPVPFNPPPMHEVIFGTLRHRWNRNLEQRERDIEIHIRVLFHRPKIGE